MHLHANWALSKTIHYVVTSLDHVAETVLQCHIVFKFKLGRLGGLGRGGEGYRILRIGKNALAYRKSNWDSL